MAGQRFAKRRTPSVLCLCMRACVQASERILADRGERLNLTGKIVNTVLCERDFPRVPNGIHNDGREPTFLRY